MTKENLLLQKSIILHWLFGISGCYLKKKMFWFVIHFSIKVVTSKIYNSSLIFRYKFLLLKKMCNSWFISELRLLLLQNTYNPRPITKHESYLHLKRSISPLYPCPHAPTGELIPATVNYSASYVYLRVIKSWAPLGMSVGLLIVVIALIVQVMGWLVVMGIIMAVVIIVMALRRL